MSEGSSAGYKIKFEVFKRAILPVLKACVSLQSIDAVTRGRLFIGNYSSSLRVIAIDVGRGGEGDEEGER